MKYLSPPANAGTERLDLAPAAGLRYVVGNLNAKPDPHSRVPKFVCPIFYDHSVAGTLASAVLRHRVIAARKKLASSWND